ncbi:hypothetical protein LCGC14_2935870 [marine sediment metagenome]|uniref:DUF3303 domain-containing protein n=1 Tax=marine sediment metagenome TaxID=412755 RepID=A0A0F9AAK1_9ZZZZ
MLFITYWELNPQMDPSALADAAQIILNKKLYPTEGVTQHTWLISADGYWGITVSEAETVEQLAKDVAVWKVAHPGLFTAFKSSPAMEPGKMIPLIMKIKKQLE